MKINFFDVLDKYKYSKGKCVKSVLAEFSSGVSVLRNKGNQSDLGTSFCPPRRVVLGHFLQLWVSLYSKHAGCVLRLVNGIVACESGERNCGCSCLKCTWSIKA